VTHRIALTALVATIAAAPAAAQFSSDIPGVPRASISVRGGHQNRTEWTFSGYRVPTTTNVGDSLAGGLRVGFGTSYRILSQFELGYDFTLLDGYAVQPPTPKTTTTTTSAAKPETYLRGLAAYGFRIGGKYRPIVALDPDGNGYEIAFGAAVQPQLKPLYGIERQGDSTRQGGQFQKNDKAVSSTFFRSNPFAKLSATTDIAAMASYRSRRLIGDVAIVAEKAADRTAVDGPSPLGVFDGVSIRAGGSYRLAPSIAVGGAFWGLGSPPWRDEVRLNVLGQEKTEQYAFLLQFGSAPEAGVDLMYDSPTGNYGQSGRLYLRFRSTR